MMTAAESPEVDCLGVKPTNYRKMYESIVMLAALNKSYPGRDNERRTESPLHPNNSPKEIFQYVANKLGQICDSRRGPSTVTSFTVLKTPEGIEYVFASNNRSKIDLGTTKAYIEGVLSAVGMSGDKGSMPVDEVFSLVFREILVTCRDKIHGYLKRFISSMVGCTERDYSQAGEGWFNILEQFATLELVGPRHLKFELTNCGKVTAALAKLEPLVSQAREALDSDVEDENAYYDAMAEIIAKLQSLQDSDSTSSVFFVVKKRAEDTNASDTKHWQELGHASGRLVTYRHAVAALFKARIMWPELFRDFTVSYVESAAEGRNPLPQTPSGAPKVAELINRCSFPDKERLKKVIAETDQLSSRVDESIAGLYKKRMTFVHAELQLLNHLENNGGTDPTRFFKDWAYIGSSKPLCKLCNFYFLAHPSGVKTRETHGNLYLAWRMPDRRDVSEKRVENYREQRLSLVREIVIRVTEEVVRVMEEKTTSLRQHDSNTVSYMPHVDEPGGVLIFTERGKANSSDTEPSLLPGDDEVTVVSEPDARD